MNCCFISKINKPVVVFRRGDISSSYHALDLPLTFLSPILVEFGSFVLLLREQHTKILWTALASNHLVYFYNLVWSHFGITRYFKEISRMSKILKKCKRLHGRSFKKNLLNWIYNFGKTILGVGVRIIGCLVSTILMWGFFKVQPGIFIFSIHALGLKSL